jgi:hypothetical protein
MAMKTSAKFRMVAMLLSLMTALGGCVGVGYPYHGGHSYGRGYGYRPIGQPYYGYGGYRGGGYGDFGHRRHHHNGDDDD